MKEFDSIITDLEQRREAIERALSALRAIGGTQSTGAAKAPKPSGATRGRKGPRSAEVRRRMSEAQRRRWAKERGDTETPAAAPARKKRRPLTAAERERLSKIMKARWASKNPPKAKATA